MVLDNEQQRQMLLSMLLASNVPGNAIEAVLELKSLIQRAEIAAPKNAPKGKE